MNVFFYLDIVFYIIIVLVVFIIFFGICNFDFNECYGGLVVVIVFEFLFKLVAFFVIGLFVIFGLYDGFGDIFSKGVVVFFIWVLFILELAGLNGWEWFWLFFLFMLVVMLLLW